MRSVGRRLVSVALAAAFAAPLAVQAADRALLIGVGKHIHQPSADLPGIDIDIDMAKGIASMMGFSDVSELRDHSATLDNVRGALRKMAQSVGSNDRVLVYFSGHGTQVKDNNGDENDGRDEALVMSDVRSNGGMLIDDEFDALLSSIPAKEVIVLVDACHSGTSTKAFQLQTASVNPNSSRSLGPGVTQSVGKSIQVDALPDVSSARGYGVAGKAEGGGSNSVSIAAAADHEVAQATGKGSLFTLGLYEAMQNAKADQAQGLTLRKMHAVAERYIKTHAADARRVHTPQLTGNLALADRPVRLASTAEGGGPVWREFEGLVADAAPLQLSLNSTVHRDGEKLQISVDIPSDGYLNVVSIGPDDVPVILFPNGFNKDNRVTRGRLALPTQQMNFDLVAQKPYGKAMVVAVLTQKRINLYESADGERDSKGLLKDVLPRVSAAGTRAYAVQARPESSGAVAPLMAARIVSRVCAASGPCDAPR